MKNYKWCFLFLYLNPDGSIELFCEEGERKDLSRLPELEIRSKEDFNFVIEYFKNYIGFDIPINKYIPLRPRLVGNKDTLIPYFIFLDGQESRLFKEKWFRPNEIKEFVPYHGAILCEVLSLFWEDFSTFKIDRQVSLRDCGMLDRPLNNPIFYGGSFNPFHQGHEECIKLCSSKGDIVVIPDQNPFKNQKKEFCSWKYFLNLCHLLKEYDCFIYPGFCGLEVNNPSYRWLKEFKSPFSLLMGDDSFISLPLWSYPEKFLIKTDKIYIVPRDEQLDQIENIKKWVKKINSKLELEFLGAHSFQKISSTQLRNKRKS